MGGMTPNIACAVYGEGSGAAYQQIRAQRDAQMAAFWQARQAEPPQVYQIGVAVGASVQTVAAPVIQSAPIVQTVAAPTYTTMAAAPTYVETFAAPTYLEPALFAAP